jgi:hypothetical protein
VRALLDERPEVREHSADMRLRQREPGNALPLAPL